MDTTSALLNQIQAVTLTTFSDEIIWDSKKPLFNTYFRDLIIKNKYKFASIDIPENMEFEAALEYLKNRESMI